MARGCTSFYYYPGKKHYAVGLLSPTTQRLLPFWFSVGGKRGRHCGWSPIGRRHKKWAVVVVWATAREQTTAQCYRRHNNLSPGFFLFFFQQSTAAILGGRTKFPFDFLVCFLLDSVDHQGRFLSINRQVDALRARNRLTVEEFSIEKKNNMKIGWRGLIDQKIAGVGWFVAAADSAGLKLLLTISVALWTGHWRFRS